MVHILVIHTSKYTIGLHFVMCMLCAIDGFMRYRSNALSC